MLNSSKMRKNEFRAYKKKKFISFFFNSLPNKNTVKIVAPKASKNK